MEGSLEKIFKQLISTGQKRPLVPGSPRDKKLRRIKNKICVCLGVRRCGKTTLMAERMAELVASGVSRENIVHINFADERLLPLHQGGWDALYTAYYGMYPEKLGKETIYLFLDELQLFRGWELFVERLRREENCEIYITGSSSALLSKEIHTALRGRSLSNELFPFSFGEYLVRKGIARDGYDTEYTLLRAKAWEEYKQCGGFPEAYEEDEETRRVIFQEYYESLLYRDLLERHAPIQPLLLKMFAHRLMSGMSTIVSINKMQNILKSMGIPCSRETLQQYLQWLEDAFFIFSIPVADASATARARSMNKVYCIDHAMAMALTTNYSDNVGQILENMVFLALRRHTQEVFYYKTTTGYEVDFLASLNGKNALIQVCADMSSPDTSKRELRALAEAMRATGLKTSYVVTENFEHTISLPEGKVYCIPAPQFLASPVPPCW